MAYIGWATGVNKIILDSTTVSVGEGAVVQDSLETGGQKKSRLVSANPPDIYSVTMEFSFADESKDSDGLTEADRFFTWYKWRHCYGTNPFKFPAILLNTNRQRGFSSEERGYIAARKNNGTGGSLTGDDVPDYEYYCITSAAEASKSGTDVQVAMTWETYATGAITIPDDTSEIDHIEAEDGHVDVVLTSTPATEPTTDTWELMVTDQKGTEAKESVTHCVFDGDVTARLYFARRTMGGTYTARIGKFSSAFSAGG